MAAPKKVTPEVTPEVIPEVTPEVTPEAPAEPVATAVSSIKDEFDGLSAQTIAEIKAGREALARRAETLVKA